VTCAACYGENAFVFRARGHAVHRCGSCGHGQITDPPDDPLSIYDAGYFEGGHDDGYAAYGASEPVLRAEFRRSLDHLRRFVDSGSLLEIGCAYGMFLEEARTYFDVLGIEASEAAAQRARARGLEVITGEMTADLGEFDAVVMLDVIEHLKDPQQVLLLVADSTHKGSALMITTGDFDSILARTMRTKWRLMTPPQHLHFFTRRSLEKMLTRTGFEIASVRRPWKRVPVQLAAYQLARAFSPLEKVVERIPPRVGVPMNLFDVVRIVAKRR